jgi:hypothetical protein
MAAACTPTRESMMGVVNDVTTRLHAAAQGAPNMTLFEPFNLFCPPSATVCTPFQEGQLAFRDQDHMNVFGSTRLVGPFMEKLGLTPR